MGTVPMLAMHEFRLDDNDDEDVVIDVDVASEGKSKKVRMTGVSNTTSVVRLDSLNVLNMEREVHVSQTLATILGLVCGVFLFSANLIVFVAAQIATENDQNMAVVTAIANGTIPLGLLASYFIYKEKLTIL